MLHGDPEASEATKYVRLPIIGGYGESVGLLAIS